MSSELSIAFQITAIGMSLVFGAIVLLWGLMALLVRLTAEPLGQAAEGSKKPAGLRELKQRAAAAAVAAAIAIETQRQTEGAASQPSAFQPCEFPLPPTASVSAWQAVRRAHLLNRRGPVR
jgi:Na+-transporting methylmalonyl-CoA/oxaloacetate decarboxylase gamma subunit